ncbi:hemolysin [Paraclostridium benzoelyticum]|uniref:Hemolysin n=1 Tax=Paraclostridium benzoelyticum TaxID=1629550 RepID=A0A0M3DJ33_9FIRM|nr:hemolysin family protein [Paraclostridium benzoelyticum]KKY00254.1 hemolysin [Paraclostridium benzoelyticum]KKY01387.1 hemolysin [Paraclostridium benzoelyticum]
MNNLDSDPGAFMPQIILIALLTAINAFFASAEMAIVSVNKSKIKQLSASGNKKAQLLEKLMEDPSNFLSTIQIGITLAGFFSSASAATGISTHLSNVLAPLSIPYYKELCMFIVTIILSYFTLVFGELVPKRIALKKAEKISLFSVKPIYIISKIAKPFIKLLSFSTSLVLKIIRNNDMDIEERVSEEEIRTLISQSQEDGCIENEEKQMIYSIFEFNDKTAKEIMTSRHDMFAVDIEDDLDEILEGVIASGYSRIPVYEDNKDNILGILYVKDLLVKAKKVGFKNINLKTMLHDPYFVSKSIRTNELFKLLKDKKVHLALLIDEYGGIEGLVTMEDLIEEIMGDIEDEYDKTKSTITQIDDSNFIVKGYLTISEFNNKFDIDIEQGDYDTLNGYILTLLGDFPEEGREIELDNFTFLIENVNKRRIEDIRVSIKNRCAQIS